MRRAAFALALAVAGCAPLTDRVVLLPGSEGASTGAVTVKSSKGEIVLAEPYAQADVVGGEPRRTQSNPQEVQQTYGRLIAAQPPRPRRFVVNFESGGDRLTADSEPILAQMRAALAGNPAAELVVVGHTDRVGSVESNDRLSLQRAQAVRDRLVAAGAARERISVAGRGEREPLIPTEDEVPEPRNRRVEIKLR